MSSHHRSPASAPSRSPASSSSWPRRASSATATATLIGAISARGSPRPARSRAPPPRVNRVEIGVDDQDYAPIPGIWELRRAVAELYNRLYRQRQALAVHRAQRLHLRRRPRIAHPGRRRAGPGEPRAFPARTTPRTRSCSTSSSSSPRSRSCSTAGGLPLQPRRTCERRSPGGGSPPCCSPIPAIRPGRVIAGDELEELGGRRARAELLAPDRRVLLPLHLARDRRRATASSPRRGTSRTWTPTRSCCSTASPRTGAIPGWRCSWIVGPQPVIDAVVQQRVVPRRRRQQAAPALRRPAARSRRGARRRPSAIRRRFLRKRDILSRRAAPGGRALRPGAGGDVLLLGRYLGAAGRRSTMGCRSFARRWSGR